MCVISLERCGKKVLNVLPYAYIHLDILQQWFPTGGSQSKSVLHGHYEYLGQLCPKKTTSNCCEFLEQCFYFEVPFPASLLVAQHYNVQLYSTSNLWMSFWVMSPSLSTSIDHCRRSLLHNRLNNRIYSAHFK